MKRTLQLATISAANIGSTLLFNWFVLVQLGPGIESDALFAGMTVPQIFASVISASLTHALAPLLAGEAEHEQRQDAWTLIALVTLLFAGVAVLLAILAPWWVRWIVPGFNPQAKNLAVLFAQISVIGIVFTGVNSIQTALAFAQNRFIWSDVAPTAASLLALVLLVLLLPTYGAIAAAWIAVGRLLLQTLFLLRGMGKPIWPEFRRPSVGILWRRLRPLLVGASYYKMDPLVDRFLASALAPGSLSLLYLAQQLHGAASQVLGKAFAVPAMTRLAIIFKAGDSAGFAHLLRRTLAIMLLVGAVAVLGIAVVGRPVLTTLMAHGQFGTEDSYTLWWMLILTSGMLIGGSIGTLTSGAFYSTGNTTTPTVLGSVSFTIGIFVKLIAFRLYALEGLALAISFYYLLSLAMMSAALYRRGLLAAGGGL